MVLYYHREKVLFEPPVEKKPWNNEIFDATKDGPVCSQIDFLEQTFIGQEDCLILNIYTSQLPNEEKFEAQAVMVFFHGGAFNFGFSTSSFYNPKSLIDMNVVIVTVNYRLGALGFLSTSNDVSPGNYGLLDQNQALKWVKKNIAQFGGNAERVTIFGESAGGASVVYHIISPLSKGLFQRAIALSGSSLCIWAFQENPVIRSQMLGISLACPIHDDQELVDCLRKTPVEDIVKHAFSFSAGFLPIVFAPTVDRRFLPDLPFNLLAKGQFNKDISFVTGITKDEGAMCYAAHHLNSSSELTQQKMKGILEGIVGTSIHTEIAMELLKKRYSLDADLDKFDVIKKKLIKMYSHGLFDKCHYQTAHLVSKANVKTFAYIYDYETSFSATEFFGTDEYLGVSHFDDVFMLFDIAPFDMKMSERDQNIRTTYQTLLSNFAKFGDPTSELSKHNFMKWNPVKEDHMTVYHVNDPITSDVYNPKEDSLYEFWTKEIPEAMLKPLPKKDEL